MKKINLIKNELKEIESKYNVKIIFAMVATLMEVLVLIAILI